MPSIASLDTLFKQAQRTIAFNFEDCCHTIDEKFGKGYASKNPHLVATLTQAMSIDLATSVFRAEAQALAEAVRQLTASTE